MALTISTGFVVDDAIVMIENISRYIEQGEDLSKQPYEARGDRVYHSLSCISLVAVLFPLFMGDIVGASSRICGDSSVHGGFRYCFFDADTDDVPIIAS